VARATLACTDKNLRTALFYVPSFVLLYCILYLCRCRAFPAYFY
jgi:hypothetical protein